MYKNTLKIVCLIFLFSCTHNANEVFISPSKHFKLQYDVNQSQTDVTKYKCIRLKLYNEKEELLDTLQSDVSTYSKWAMAWHPENDTIILNSRDVGIYAYKIVGAKKLVNIKITPKLNLLADSIFNKKYSNH